MCICACMKNTWVCLCVRFLPNTSHKAQWVCVCVCLSNKQLLAIILKDKRFKMAFWLLVSPSLVYLRWKKKLWSVTRNDIPPRPLVGPLLSASLHLTPLCAELPSLYSQDWVRVCVCVCVHDEDLSIHVAVKKHRDFGVACKLLFFTQLGRIQSPVFTSRIHCRKEPDLPL